jgi:hypothetical protein
MVSRWRPSSPSLTSLQIDGRHLGVKAVDTLFDGAAIGVSAHWIGLGGDQIERRSKALFGRLRRCPAVTICCQVGSLAHLRPFRAHLRQIAPAGSA